MEEADGQLRLSSYTKPLQMYMLVTDEPEDDL